MEQAEFEGWVILELMGRRRLAGYLRCQQIGGAPFIRIDVPRGADPSVTQMYRPEAIYCITPTTEVIARALGQRERPEPVSPFELRLEAPPRGPLHKGERCPNCNSDYLQETASLGLACPNCALEMSFGHEDPEHEEDDAF
jgi:hypothetical protein